MPAFSNGLLLELLTLYNNLLFTLSFAINYSFFILDYMMACTLICIKKSGKCPDKHFPDLNNICNCSEPSIFLQLNVMNACIRERLAVKIYLADTPHRKNER